MTKRTRVDVSRCKDCFAIVVAVDVNKRCAHCAELAAKWPGWSIALCEPQEPAGAGCQPTVLARYFTGDRPTVYRGACFACTWTGPVREDDSNAAVEDAHDHTHPGWRNLPLAPSVGRTGDARKDAKKVERLGRELLAIYPSDWPERAGPIRTLRRPMGTRHVPGYSPWGGYDICAGVEGETYEQVEPAGQMALFL